MSVWQRLNQWYRTPLGEQLLSCEQQSLLYVMDRIPGCCLLQVAGPFCFPLPVSKRRFYWTQLVTELSSADSSTQFVADLSAFPVAPGTFDVVLLPHTLAFVEHPFSILKQAHQALKEGGYLVLFSFNSFSFWGLARYSNKKRQTVPWVGHFHTASQVRRWLKQLELTLALQTSLFYRPPFNDQARLQQWLFIEGIGQICWPLHGASLVTVAAKKPSQGVCLSVRELFRHRAESGDPLRPISP